MIRGESYIDALIRVTSEPARLQPRRMVGFVSESKPIAIYSATHVTAYVRFAGGGEFEFYPRVTSDEPSDDRYAMRLASCCEVAEVLVASFGGTWSVIGGEVICRPMPGTDARMFERSAVAAFAIRGMKAVSL